jgi:ssDNA-binding Zn-finger/Zn-ribbon topoisomerase 1
MGALRNLAASLCGLTTTILTIVALLVVSSLLGFDLFTVMVWFIVPMGAVASGLVAASGYYLGAVMVHQRPTRWLLLQMVVLAGVTQFAVYFLQYLSVTLEDGRALAEVMGFKEYLAASLTSAEYTIGHSKDGVTLGAAGYLVAGVQFLGFLAGGAAIYFMLLAKPYCEACGKYFRKITGDQKKFLGADQFNEFSSRLDAAEPFSDAFFTTLGEKHERTLKETKQGAVNLDVALLECPECKRQRVSLKAQQFSGNGWKELGELKLVVPPEGRKVTKTEFDLRVRQKSAA